jgi:tetratricopeptide (TPR) repeat protein
LRIVPLIAVLAAMASAAPAAVAKTTATIADSDTMSGGMGKYLSARFAAGYHDYAPAARMFRESAMRDPGNAQLATLAFFYSADAGEMDEAVKFAGQLVTLVPDDRAARLTLAVAALKARDYKRARTEINKSAKVPFTSFTVALIDGWAAAGMGDGGGAKDDFKLLHAQKSADGLAYFNEALVAEYLGDKDGAEANYRLALEVAGPMPRAIDAFGRFLERNGRGAEAREIYTKLASDAGYSVVTGPGLARIAAGVIPEPFAPRPEDAASEALFGIASSLNDEAGRDVSVLYLRLALYLNPKLDIATILLANRFEAMGKYDDAIKIYGTIAPGAQFYRAAAVATAVDLARQEKNDEAIARLSELTKQYPDDLEAWSSLGDAYRVAKRYGDAVRAYDKALQVGKPDPKKNWALLYFRAVAEQEAGNWPRAESDLKQALVYSPNEPQVLNYLGYSWVDQQRNIKEALTMLEKARALSPQDGYIIDSVGWAYYRLGRFDEAVDALEDAVQLVPGDPTINDHLGDAYWKVGRSLDAKFQWNHALAFGPEPGDKAKIEKKLKSVE